MTGGKNTIQMGHHMNFGAGSNTVAGSTKGQGGAGHLHQRTGSTLSSHTAAGQLMFMDPSSTSHTTVNQINRKSSIEAKIGNTAQAAVTGGIKPEGEQIRSKAQYDNWLQLQVMKKATGGTSGGGGAGRSATSTGNNNSSTQKR